MDSIRYKQQFVTIKELLVHANIYNVESVNNI